MIGHVTPQAHSGLVGGSTAARRLGCPRSFALEQRVPPEDRSSIYALEGSALHDLLAIALDRDVEPTTLLPFIYTDSLTGVYFIVDAGLWADKGEPALRAFDTFVAEQEQRLGAPMRVLIETRVVFPGIPGAFGTSDIIACCGNEIFVMDWKFGRGIVPATENKQLMFYACGALNTARSFFGRMSLTAETPVTLVILQPALDTGIDVWRIDVSRLSRFEIELQAAAQLIQEQGIDAPIQIGSWCQFARCKVICPLHIGAAAKLAERFAAPPPAAAGKNFRPNDWPEQLADLLALADMVEDWAREVRDQARQSAERGMMIPGWVLEPGRRGPRKWAMDEDTVQKTFTGPEFGLDIDAVAPRRVLTPPQMEKILKRIDKAVPEGFTAQSEPSAARLVRAENAAEVVKPTAARARALAERLMGIGDREQDTS